MMARHDLTTTFPALIAQCCKLLCETLTHEWHACTCTEAFLQLLFIAALITMINVGIGCYTLGLIGVFCLRCITEAWYWVSDLIIRILAHRQEARTHVSTV